MEKKAHVSSVEQDEQKCFDSVTFDEIILNCRCDIVDLFPDPEILPLKDISQTTLQAWFISEFRILDIWLSSVPLLDRISKADFINLYECTYPSIAILRMAFLSRKLENGLYFVPYGKMTVQTSRKFCMSTKLYQGIRNLADEMKTLNCTDITFIALLLFTQPDVDNLLWKGEVEQLHDLAIGAFFYWRDLSSDEYWAKIFKILSMLRRQDHIILFLFWMARSFIKGTHPAVTMSRHLMWTVGKPNRMQP